MRTVTRRFFSGVHRDRQKTKTSRRERARYSARLCSRTHDWSWQQSANRPWKAPRRTRFRASCAVAVPTDCQPKLCFSRVESIPHRAWPSAHPCPLSLSRKPAAQTRWIQHSNRLRDDQTASSIATRNGTTSASLSRLAHPRAPAVFWIVPLRYPTMPHGHDMITNPPQQ